MNILKVEVNSTSSSALEPTEIIGIVNLCSIEKTDNSNHYDLFISGRNGSYRKSFNTKESRDKYFDYIGSKLEIIDLSPIKTQE